MANLGKDTLQSDCQKVQHLSELANVIPIIAKSDLLTTGEIVELKQSSSISLPKSILPKLPMFDITVASPGVSNATAPYLVSSATSPDDETMEASLLMSPDYVQPLFPSELNLLVQQIFEPDMMSYLRHSAAKKLINWQAKHPLLTLSTSPAPSVHGSTSGSPIPSPISNSGVLVPFGSDLSLRTPNSHALAELADHTQREERLAQVRLTRWASDLQLSLQRERERYDKVARGDRAMWLVDRLGEEVKDGRVVPVGDSGALVKTGSQEMPVACRPSNYATHDPLGLLRWNESIRTRGWVALQVVGSFGVVGGLALWLAKTWGIGSEWQRWAEEWGWN